MLSSAPPLPTHSSTPCGLESILPALGMLCRSDHFIAKFNGHVTAQPSSVWTSIITQMGRSLPPEPLFPSRGRLQLFLICLHWLFSLPLRCLSPPSLLSALLSVPLSHHTHTLTRGFSSRIYKDQLWADEAQNTIISLGLSLGP